MVQTEDILSRTGALLSAVSVCFNWFSPFSMSLNIPSLSTFFLTNLGALLSSVCMFGKNYDDIKWYCYYTSTCLSFLSDSMPSNRPFLSTFFILTPSTLGALLSTVSVFFSSAPSPISLSNTLRSDFLILTPLSTAISVWVLFYVKGNCIPSLGALLSLISTRLRLIPPSMEASKSKRVDTLADTVVAVSSAREGKELTSSSAKLCQWGLMCEAELWTYLLAQQLWQ